MPCGIYNGARWVAVKRVAKECPFTAAPNPPFGAVFTYYLKEKLKNQQETRRETEKKIEKDGGNTPYPGWDALRQEELEEEPSIVFTVRDASGEIIRRMSGEREAGFHRIAWDLRYPNLDPWTEEEEESFSPPVGVLALPGRFTVTMEKRQNGKFTQIGEPQSFNVRSIREPRPTRLITRTSHRLCETRR